MWRGTGKARGCGGGTRHRRGGAGCAREGEGGGRRKRRTKGKDDDTGRITAAAGVVKELRGTLQTQSDASTAALRVRGVSGLSAARGGSRVGQHEALLAGKRGSTAGRSSSCCCTGGWTPHPSPGVSTSPPLPSSSSSSRRLHALQKSSAPLPPLTSPTAPPAALYSVLPLVLCTRSATVVEAMKALKRGLGSEADAPPPPRRSTRLRQRACPAVAQVLLPVRPIFQSFLSDLDAARVLRTSKKPPPALCCPASPSPATCSLLQTTSPFAVYATSALGTACASFSWSCHRSSSPSASTPLRLTCHPSPPPSSPCASELRRRSRAGNISAPPPATGSTARSGVYQSSRRMRSSSWRGGAVSAMDPASSLRAGARWTASYRAVFSPLVSACGASATASSSPSSLTP